MTIAYIVDATFIQNHFLFHEKIVYLSFIPLTGIDMECKDVRSLVTYWHTTTDQSSEFTIVVFVTDLGSLTGD